MQNIFDNIIDKWVFCQEKSHEAKKKKKERNLGTTYGKDIWKGENQIYETMKAKMLFLIEVPCDLYINILKTFLSLLTH